MADDIGSDVPSDLARGVPQGATQGMVSRRRALQVTFCSSVALALNIRRPRVEAAVDPAGLHMLAIGDFGTTGKDQAAVAAAMRAYRERAGIRLQALLLLGDNIYNRVPAGLAADSPHWRAVFEDMYPSQDFDCPCYAVLGNHDYSDNADGPAAQLAYAKRPGTRWRMPAKWYRFDVTDGALLHRFAKRADGGVEVDDG